MPKENSQKISKQQPKPMKKPKIHFTNYPVGDFLIKLKNITGSHKKELVCGKTKLIKEVAVALKRLGYLAEIKEEDRELRVRLAYKDKEPVLTTIRIISKPGLRVYKSKDELTKFKSPSIWLLSTSKGILSSREAIKKAVGGEVLAEIL